MRGVPLINSAFGPDSITHVRAYLREKGKDISRTHAHVWRGEECFIHAEGVALAHVELLLHGGGALEARGISGV